MTPKSASRDEIVTMARVAGLELEPHYMDELVEAYRNIEPMLQRIRRDRARADEPAHTFDPRKFMSK